MKWIRAHKLLTAMISVVVLLCLTISLSYLTEGNMTPVGRGIQKVTSTIQRPISGIAHGVQNGLVGIFRFKEVVAENEALKSENSKLRNEITNLMLQEKDLQDLRGLANVLNYEGFDHGYQVVAANVTSLDGTNWFNIFRIDRGSDSGIYKGAVVVNGDGLVGIIMEVGDNWSKVISIIDETNKVSFKVQRDLSFLGIMQGDGNGGLEGFMLDNEAGVTEGNILITSGIGMYPEGIEIGKVTSVDYNTDTQLKTVAIEPSVSFKSLQKVAVIL